MAIPSQASEEEGVETVRHPPTGEETVQLTNRKGNESCSETHNRWIVGSSPTAPTKL